MKKELKLTLAKPDFSIKEVIKVIDSTGLGLALIVDGNKKLLGMVTDGDIRRAIIRKNKLDTKISKIMNKNPVTAYENWTRYRIVSLLSKRIKRVPIIDWNGILKDLVSYEDLRIQEKEKQNIIRAKVPLRISFAGGGTDINPYIEESSGIVLSTTINKYCCGTLIKRKDSKINITSYDYKKTVKANGIDGLKYDGDLDLFKAVIKLMKPDYGMDLYFESDVPPGTGMGGSAASAVVLIGLINSANEFQIDDYCIAELAFQAERVEIRISGGWQDQYSAIFGGFNFMEFNKNDTIVHPLRINKDILNELRAHLLLGYTGMTRLSGDILKKQIRSYVKKDRNVISALDETKAIALRMKDTLLKGNMMNFGKLLHKAWLIKKKFSSDISNSQIDNIYNRALEYGAIGGKILGAGGGGFLLLFCPILEKRSIKEKLEKKGLTFVDFDFTTQGLETWTTRQET